MRTRLSLVLPAFNEQAGIRQAIREADEALCRLCDEYEVLVVDDGSTDATADLVREEASGRPNVRLIRHESNRGYGAALRTGFELARFDLVAFTDADCQFFLDDLDLLMPHAETSPVVVGYRIDRKDVWRRRLLSGGYNLLARTLLGTTVRDIDCALKVFRREALTQILPESDGFFVNTEMLTRARQLGLDVAEVGVRHRPRARGQSTVSLREVPRTLGRLLPFWWSEVMFARLAAHAGSEKKNAKSQAEATPERRTLSEADPDSLGSREGCRFAFADRLLRARLAGPLLILLVACLLFFVRLRVPLVEPQEGRNAEIARLMLAQGRFIVPTLHEQDYLDKPPMLYWCVAGSYRLFGVHDWAARLVPCLAGVLTALVTYFWGRRAFGERAGLCGALLLCLLPEFVYRGRMLTCDALLVLWVTAALAAAHASLLAPRLRWWWWLVSAVACGLGLLTKGPVALALVVPPLVIVGWLDRRLACVGWRGWALFFGGVLLTAAPWYTAMFLERPDHAGYFFWKHNVTRYVAPFDHARPAWFYLPGLAVGLMPWLLLPVVLGRMLFDRSARMAQMRPGALGLALVCFFWALLFFSTAGSKRPSYLLPALPPLALALGWVIATRAPDWKMLLVRGSRLATATGGLALLVGIGLALTAAQTQMIRPAVGFTLAASAVGALVVLIGARRISWGVAGLAVFATLFVGLRELLPAYNDQFSLRGQLRRQAGAAERMRQPVVCYPARYDSVGFYLPEVPLRVFRRGQKRDLIAYLEANPGSLVVIKSASYRELTRDLPPDLHLRVIGRQGMVTVGRVVQEQPRLAGDGRREEYSPRRHPIQGFPPQ